MYTKKPKEMGSKPMICGQVYCLKGRSLKWITTAWKKIEDQPIMAINGFRKAGIMDAVLTIRGVPI